MVIGFRVPRNPLPDWVNPAIKEYWAANRASPTPLIDLIIGKFNGEMIAMATHYRHKIMLKQLVSQDFFWDVDVLNILKAVMG